MESVKRSGKGRGMIRWNLGFLGDETLWCDILMMDIKYNAFFNTHRTKSKHQL